MLVSVVAGKSVAEMAADLGVDPSRLSCSNFGWASSGGGSGKCRLTFLDEQAEEQVAALFGCGVEELQAVAAKRGYELWRKAL